MARTTIPISSLPGPVNPCTQLLSLTNFLSANGAEVLYTKGLFLIVFNAGASQDLTVSGAPNKLNRDTDDVRTIGAAAICGVGPFTSGVGWAQSDGMIYLDSTGDNLSVFACVV